MLQTNNLCILFEFVTLKTLQPTTAVLDLIFSTHLPFVFYFRITTDDAVSLQRNV